MTNKAQEEKRSPVQSGTSTAANRIDYGRRKLIKGAATTVPMILTLQSGAVLARSSNLISASSEASATDMAGNTLCLDANSAIPLEDGLYDLGEPPRAMVWTIPGGKQYRTLPNSGSMSEVVTPKQMCERGGDFYYNEFGWQEVNCPQGMLVSATALSSFSGYVYFQDITEI